MGPRFELTRTPRGLRTAHIGLRVPAFRVLYAPEAQGGLPPGRHALYAPGTRTSLGRAPRAVVITPPHTRRGAPRGYHPPQVLRVERHAAGFGQQTHFRIERASPRPHPDASRGGGAEVVWLRARATGGYVNYRGENFVRGHGNHRTARSP